MIRLQSWRLFLQCEHTLKDDNCLVEWIHHFNYFRNGLPVEVSGQLNELLDCRGLLLGGQFVQFLS
jgi:hypothetical protein